MKIVAAIIARMGAGRLPAKAMYPLAGRPVIAHVIDRMRLLKGVDEVAVFTTDGPGDDPLAEYAEKEMQIPVFRGSVSPIERVAAGLEWLGADVYVHGAAVDNPLFWTAWIGDLTEALISERADFAAVWNPEGRRTVNAMTHSLSPYSTRAIKRILEGARRAGGRYLDHVNLWMLHNPKRFEMAFVRLGDGDPFWQWRPCWLRMDTAVDCVVMGRVFEALYQGQPLDTWGVVKYLEANPELARTNLPLEKLASPYMGEANYEEGWVMRSWRNQMLQAKVPEGGASEFCSSGSCYLGYAMQEENAGAPGRALHLPDGSVIVGTASLSCPCGAGLRWP